MQWPQLRTEQNRTLSSELIPESGLNNLKVRETLLHHGSCAWALARAVAGCPARRAMAEAGSAVEVEEFPDAVLR
jgi:hypothetical protein